HGTDVGDGGPERARLFRRPPAGKPRVQSGRARRCKVAMSTIALPMTVQARGLSLPREGGGRNATGLDGRRSRHGIRRWPAKPDGVPGGGDGGMREKTPPPGAPNELAPRVACRDRWSKRGVANSWRAALPPR